MYRPLIAANWKMNGNKKSVSDLATQMFDLHCDADVVIFPPYVLINSLVQAFSDTAIKVGGQNISEYDSGAYTGEISSVMLKDIGCEYCLVGHSERRHLFGEDNSQVASKFYQSNRVGLNPILCLGETLEQREKNQTIDTISSQIEAVLKYSEKNLPSAMLIAYEPVWAIGSGSPAGLDQIKNVHQYIRSKLHSYEIEARILYGGSVTSRNAGDLLKESEVDGLLIGGASLDAELFAQICKLA